MVTKNTSTLTLTLDVRCRQHKRFHRFFVEGFHWCQLMERHRCRMRNQWSSRNDFDRYPCRRSFFIISSVEINTRFSYKHNLSTTLSLTQLLCAIFHFIIKMQNFCTFASTSRSVSSKSETIYIVIILIKFGNNFVCRSWNYSNHVDLAQLVLPPLARHPRTSV